MITSTYRANVPTRRGTRARRALTGLAAGVSAAAMILVGPGSAAAQTTGDPPTVASPQQATPTEKVAAGARPAIVYLAETFTGYVAGSDGGYFNDGRPYRISARCTGFGVNPNGYIATAGHCVDVASADGMRMEFILAAARELVAEYPELPLADVVAYGRMNWTVEGETKGSPIETEISVVAGAVGPGTQAGVMPARVVDYRPWTQGDVALLKVEVTDLPSIELAGDANVQIGTPVLSVGYPAHVDTVTDPGLEPSNKDGQISSKKTVGGVPVYEISAGMAPGDSGGPTLAMDGRVLGINSFGASEASEAFNFIAPAAGLSELLSRNGVRNELGPNDILYRDGLAAYYGGRYTESIADFDELLQIAPQHAQAVQFRAAAAKAKQQFGDAVPAPAPSSDLLFGLSPLVLWIVLGAGAAALLIVPALIVVRRRRQESLPGPNLPATAAAHGWSSGAVPGASSVWTPPWAQPTPASTFDNRYGSAASPAPSPTPQPTTQPTTQNQTTLLTPSGSAPCHRCGAPTPAASAFCAVCGFEQRA
jgi:S1-C subfamily serine protease